MHPLLGQVDWQAQGVDAVGLLRALLRFDTRNPPGNEASCAAFAADHLRETGLEPHLLHSARDRGNVLARLNGDGDEPPLLLNAHLDVVPVEEDRWTHPPFAGHVAGGYVWGRGAVDMKNMAAMSLVALRLLSTSGARLRRDVIFAGVADEEAGCEHGSAWLVDHHPDKVRAGYALGEVGGSTMHVGGRPIYPVQVAEKGVCWIRARASGTTGHGSVPRPDNAVVSLATFLARVGRTRLPVRASKAVERFVRGLAATQDQPARSVLPLLLHPRLSATITDRLMKDRGTARLLDAVLRNTATPTVLSAGAKTNVIPSTAEADIDGRIAVGASSDDLLAELTRLASPDITLEVIRSRAPYEAPAETELFTTIAAVVEEHHPGAHAVPSVTPGFTDAHYWARLGTVCYGFVPTRLEPGSPDFAGLFHGDDERVPVDGFVAGLRMLADVVFRFCVA